MNQVATTTPVILKLAIRHFLGTATLLLIMAVGSLAQTRSTDGATPSGLTPGSPAGSYSLSDFESINPYNGNLSFRLPLLKIGGRGEAGYTMMLKIEQHWTVTRDSYITSCYPSSICNYAYVYYPTPGWWGGLSVGYGPGVLQGRQVSDYRCNTGSRPDELKTKLTRLTFTAADGTEFELRDVATDGKPIDHSVYNLCNSYDYPVASRGTVFVTKDGSSATFTSDTTIYDFRYGGVNYLYPSGYLSLRNGTRYRIDNGLVTWIRDRNGNKVSFTYNINRQVASITDSLNRKVTVTYGNGGPYDEIAFKGTGGAPRTIRIWRSPLGQALRSGYTLKTFKELFPALDGSSTSTYEPGGVVSAVELPDGRRYQLRYNSYAELARVELPTGGAIEYDIAPGLNNSSDSDGGVVYRSETIGGVTESVRQIYRRVVERRVYPDGVTLVGKMTYSRPEGSSSNLGYVEVDELNSAGALLTRSRHYYSGSPVASLYQKPLYYSSWNDGRERQTEELDDDGTTVLRRVVNTWQQREAVSWWASNGYLGPEPPNDPRLIQTDTTLVDTNKVTRQTFDYDQYNNQTDIYEYNYGNGAAGSLLRRTHTYFVTTNVVGGVTYNYDTDTAIHLRSLPEQVSVYNAAGVEQARTTFEYDNYTATANHAGLVARSGISGLDPAFTTAKKARGNATATIRYLLTNGAVTGSISTYQLYDVAGNTVKVIDGQGYQISFNFSDRFGSPDADARLNSGAAELGAQFTYAFPSLVTNALGQTSYTQRDYYTGQMVDVEDPNGVTSSAYYGDDLDRPTQVIQAADDTALRRQTTFIYDDTNLAITTTSDLSSYGDNLLKSQTRYDGLGRPIEARSYETPTTYITTKQTYDALGRPSQKSNPYRAGQTVVWTTTTYDALGRVISIKTPDNAVVKTGYSANTVTVTDQAGKDRQSTTDALGRLTQVVEDPGGLGYVTTYAYDTLGNLTKVIQDAQTRTFVYDSLSRLKTATNPESGTVSYSYDDNGNLTQKKDARSVITTISYDALNRPTLKNYSDATSVVTYFYDSQTLPTGAPTFVRGYSKGRLVAVTTGGTSEGSYYGYDGLGRVLRRIQRTDSVNYTAEATYNRAGAMVTQTYPAVPGATDRRTVSYSFDGTGRLSSLDSDPTTYASGASVGSISYAAHGAIASENLGNNLIHGLTYNTRLQPTQLKLGTSASPTSVLNLTYNYGTTTNNGDVLSVTHKVGTWTTKQTYIYDSLNRIDSTTETNGSTTTYWTEDNAYDRYGNRWEVIGGLPSLTFNTANNRINRAGYAYDASGNLTNDTAHTYGFNAENFIKSVDGVADTYRYDGEGHRVRKYFPLGEKLRFVYGVGGQLIMEFDVTSGALQKEYVYGAGGLLATIEPTKGTSYMTADHLGSLRVVTGGTGAVISRHDYKPFGQELFAGTGGRTAAQFYGVDDGLRQKFTGKERDDETGLDYFGARYYSSSQGRFTSADPLLTSGQASVPQTWNRYSYCLNNPLVLVDPNGLDPKWVYQYRGDEKIAWGYVKGDTAPSGWYEIPNEWYVERTSTYSRINTVGGETVTLFSDGHFRSEPGSRKMSPAPNSQEALNSIGGMVDSIPLLGPSITGLFGGVGDKESPQYQNARQGFRNAIDGALLLSSGGASLPGCLVDVSRSAEIMYIGKLAATTSIAERQLGANLINYPPGRWNMVRQDARIQEHIDNRGTFSLESAPTMENFFNRDGSLSVFGRECFQCVSNGYQLSGRYFVPPQR